MKEELAQAAHLTVQGERGELVRDVDLLLRASECCLLASPDESRNTLTGVFKGEGMIREGCLRIRGKTAGLSRTAMEEKKVYIVDGSMPFLNSLDVSENMFLLKQNSRRKLFLNEKALHLQAGALFEEYGLACRPDERIGNLSAAERVKVSMVKAAGQGAKLLVLRDVTSDDSAERVEELLKLIAKLREKGLGILIADNHPEYFIPLADRLFVMSADGIERKIYDREDFAPALERMSGEARSAVSSRQQEENRGRGRAEVFVQDICLCGYEPFDLMAQRGEILLLLIRDGKRRRQLWDVLSGKGEFKPRLTLNGRKLVCRDVEDFLRNGIAFWGYGTDSDRIFPNLSAADNVALPSLRRMSGMLGGYRRQEKVLMEDEGFFAPGLSNIDTRRASGEERNRLILSRLKLLDPAVLLIYNIFSNADPASREWMAGELETMAARGTAVVMIEADTKAAAGLAGNIFDVEERQRRENRWE